MLFVVKDIFIFFAVSCAIHYFLWSTRMSFNKGCTIIYFFAKDDPTVIYFIMFFNLFNWKLFRLWYIFHFCCLFFFSCNFTLFPFSSHSGSCSCHKINFRFIIVIINNFFLFFYRTNRNCLWNYFPFISIYQCYWSLLNFHLLLFIIFGCYL